MFSKVLNGGSIVLLALNIMACCLLTPTAPPPKAADIEKEEQAV